MVKNALADAGDAVLIPWVKKLPEKEWQLTPLLPGKFHKHRESGRLYPMELQASWIQLRIKTAAAA